ncbi:MAG: 3-phosphoshikimate 1-carboxyvinyltransferase [Bacteroidales bacterium]|nr:3-phosphoshikimate 1-carboxyvinyltransferase [Bacteroidales bacterium]
MEYCLHKPNHDLVGEVTLPSSKSISNRLLIIQALSPAKFHIDNLSDSDDTRELIRALEPEQTIIDVGHAGTTMRFLTAYLSLVEGERLLTGSERMQNRPIGKLVDSLKQLGADIIYSDKEGYPPLQISGKKLDGGLARIDSSVSSQFVSALLMVAPVFKNGLQLELEKRTVSSAYIHLTLNLMKEMGIGYTWEGNTISIPHQAYKPKDLKVEADWSAASYWYEMAALADKVDLKIYGLSENSLQGDAVVSGLFGEFGVRTTMIDGGILLSKGERTIREFNYHFIDQPDLVQTFCVLCSLLSMPFRFTGTESLKIKETDRIDALQRELAKFNVQIEASIKGDEITFDGNSVMENIPGIRIDTYQDHRMAMAFAPAAFILDELHINDPDVITKSYPGFWDDLTRVGFKIKQ